MPPNLLNMLFSWAALLALFAALATATPVDGNALLNGNPLFDPSLIENLRVNISLILKENNLTMNDDYGCGRFSTADYWNIADLLYGPEKGGVAGLRYDPDCTVPARSCRRKLCFNTSAIYICNDNIYTVHPSCDVVSMMSYVISTFCCGHYPHKLTGISGQIFMSPEQGWNTIVAYGNCNHGEYDDLPSMGGPADPWGPNGSCFET